MAPRRFVSPFQSKPDLNTPPTSIPAEEVDEVVEAATAIILEANEHRTVTRLVSGSTRIDRLMATAEELEVAKVEKELRRQQRCLAIGSAE